MLLILCAIMFIVNYKLEFSIGHNLNLIIHVEEFFKRILEYSYTYCGIQLLELEKFLNAIQLHKIRKIQFYGSFLKSAIERNRIPRGHRQKTYHVCGFGVTLSLSVNEG